MKKILSTLLFACLLNIHFLQAKTALIPSATIINGTGWNSGSSVTISASHLTGNNLNGAGEIMYMNKELKSYVKFSLNTLSIPASLTAFTAKMTVNITYYLEGVNYLTPVSATKVMELTYDPTLGAKYKNVDVYSIPNAYKIQVSVIPNSLQLLDNTSTAISPITSVYRDFISLQAFTEREFYNNFDGIYGAPPSYTYSSGSVSATPGFSNSGELVINWMPIPLAEGYELEYTFVDDYSNTLGAYIPDNQLSFSFRNNSTRVLVPGNSYTMPLIQEHGYLLFRVRGYGIAGDNFERIFYGPFPMNTGGTNPNQSFTIASFPNQYYINNSSYIHTNDKINWQSVTTFAEEGKSKTIVKYMDGMMRTRQTVTSTSTEKNAIVAETIYDRQGRPAVNIMPAPVDNPAIKYYGNFNQNMAGQPYSFADFDVKGTNACDPFIIKPLKQNNNEGAGNYYSQYNPNKTLFNAFIPEANGYPFSRVLYMPDPTDRVVRQGGVGEIFQPGLTGQTGSNPYQQHDTKYYYGKPVQEELDQLFGTNVGYTQFYQKNLVVDANGQASVSYVDLDGKTIATALAGKSPESLDQLPSFQVKKMDVDLLDSSDVIDNQNHSITHSQSFLVSSDKTKYDFNYVLKPKTYNALQCEGKNYCLDCIYDLEISLVRDECGLVVYTDTRTIGKLSNLDFICNNADAGTNLDFNALLNIGSYTITRKLLVNKQAAESYANSIINDPKNSCLKPYKAFYNEAWKNRDTTRCLNPCDACKAESKTEVNEQLEDALKACDSLWCHPQIATMCDIARMSMINDLTPGGQYAEYRDASGNINLVVSGISIFNDILSSIGIKKLMNAPAPIPNIQISLPGEPTQALSYYYATGHPERLIQLIANWPDDLSEKLLPLHPEYCYLKFCDLPQMQNSNNFDTKFMNASTYAEAEAANLATNGSALASFINTFYDKDPFYQYLTATFKTQMQTKFDNFAGAGNSMVKLALFTANCPSSSNISTCPGAWANGSNDNDEWNKFKAFYFALKQEFIQKAREHYVSTQGCCPNSYIGCENDNCPPIVWHSLTPMPNPYPCFTTALNPQAIRGLYQHADRRFVGINDIDFEVLPAPNESIYDMTNDELLDYMNSANAKPPCPTCPELDAFKMMVWHIQSKGWIQQNKTVKADEIIGMKDALRQRFLGSLNNEDIHITHSGSNNFSISSNGCTLTFQSDSIINWEKASILPTCLSITDYKHAILNAIVEGSFKTAIQISSTCDIFYCDGEKPSTLPIKPCSCDSLYNSTKVYRLGNIVQYNGSCYLLKKVQDEGELSPGLNPGNKMYWDKLCEIIELCQDPFNIDFETPATFNTALGVSVGAPAGAGRYTIQQTYPINTLTFPSKVLIVHPDANNQLLIEKNATVIPGKQYKISFDAKNIIDRTMQIELKVNNQTINTYTTSWLSTNLISVTWSNTVGNSAQVSIYCVAIRSDKADEIAIDNFKMICLDNAISGNNNSSGGSSSTSSTSRYIPASVCGCNSLCDPELPLPPLNNIPCDSILKDIATQQANNAYANYRDSVFNALLNGYYAHCMKAVEQFKMKYEDAEYHYTLYYYDQSGNLVRTVPPAGVLPITNTTQLDDVKVKRDANSATAVVPQHFMTTTYQHNSLNAVVWQKTPDAGVSEFFYDGLGRIALSQNAKQQPIKKASYTYYDRLGRNAEVGEVNVAGVSNLKQTAFDYKGWTTFLNTKARTEITHTYYDKTADAIIDIAFGSNGQQYLRNRIGTVALFSDKLKLASLDYDHATHYNYDIAGNVTDLLQDFGKHSDFGTTPNNIRTQSKHIAYRFDLVSGKVNEVHYQQGYPDQFLHKYEYNADNKLTAVFTSTNGIVWENDARYTYYRHGPLARMELGTDKVQGVDYAYTLQGWMKGVNGEATIAAHDLGQDGIGNNGNVGYQAQNKNVAPDVFSYWLGYHKQDYKPITGSSGYMNNALQPLTSGNYHNNAAELFNGNIRSMYTYLQPFVELIGMHYKYDQLNRIKKQEAFDFNSGAMMGTNYSMQLDYDPNGNIQKLIRFGGIRVPNAMDDLRYHYYNTNGSIYSGNPIGPDATNKLAYVKDAVNATNYTDDIDAQSPNNYTYDAIGNLISDNQEGISQIEWNIQNKITEIVKTNGKNIFYSYDALGNRIKKVVVNTTPGFAPATQYYVRDAQGNTMAIYEMKNDDLHWAEQHIYGSSRLGMYKTDLNLTMLPTDLSTTRNTTEYELSNHLGNVLSTITDSKTNTNGATLLTATDYYAFGMAMPDRKYTLNNAKFRYGFNGKENDAESGTQDYGMRIYNPALGRFLSTDPLIKDYPELSTYQFASNTPIWAIDLDGLEAWKLSETNNMSQQGYQQHINDTYKAFLENPNEFKIKTDCAKFQFLLMLKYYEKTGQQFSFTGKNGKVYDSHAKDKNGNYVYKDFNSFFQKAKLGVSSVFLRKKNNGITEPKPSGEPVVSGDLILHPPQGGQAFGHAEGLVVGDNNKTDVFYSSGLDTEPTNCEGCDSPDSYPASTSTFQNSSERFSWDFIGKLPQVTPSVPVTPTAPADEPK